MHTAEEEARRLDAADPGHRHLFHVPPADGGRYPEAAYLAGNSLGLQPRATREELLADLDAWGRLGVAGHLEARRPWLPYHELLTGPAARLVGARPAEAVVMNSLTVNLHLLMVSFYRPAGERTRIVIEDTAFPSDSYAVRSQARFHGLDPDATVVRLTPRPGEDTLRTSDVVDFLAAEGHTVALVLLGGVNYLTGELLDIPAMTAAGRAAGAVVGWDLAHAAGNVPLALHDWDVDFAAWCSYKYLNSGRARWPARSSTSATSAGPTCPASRAGGAPRPAPGSRWPRCPGRRPPWRRGRCPTRRSSRWGRCARRWSCSTPSACRRCASAACGSPDTWSGCSTRSPPAGR
ncbi:hypothetical protein GCM10010429_28440 [Micromonospora olivasterospora]